MDNPGLPKEILDGAYRIFIQEMAEHLSGTEFVLNEKDLSQHPQLKDAKTRFHKIKGGAGFFGFTEIEKAASDLEKIIKDMLAQKPTDVETLRTLYVRMTELVKESLEKV